MGRTRRILLSDTLLADYSDDEIEVVLAHELSHHVHHDLWRGFALQAVLLVGGFFAAAHGASRRAGTGSAARLADPAGLPAAAAGRRHLLVPLLPDRERRVARAGAARPIGMRSR